jgi:hemerythrin-like metal-binding protein
MPTLQWSEAVELGLPFIDDTHREFVDLLAAAESATDDSLPRIWNELVEHTADHFGREDLWMKKTGFSSSNCHSIQHKVVLQVLREGNTRAAAGDLAPARQMIRELAEWFPAHAQSMDNALALHLRSVGYDPATDSIGRPDALPADEIKGCGGATCTPALEI